MSRGPGRWQRAILDAVAQLGPGDQVLLKEHVESGLGRRLSAAEQRALNRAATRLEAQGRVRCLYDTGPTYGRRSLPRRLYVLTPITADTEVWRQVWQRINRGEEGEEPLGQPAPVKAGRNGARRLTFVGDE